MHKNRKITVVVVDRKYSSDRLTSIEMYKSLTSAKTEAIVPKNRKAQKSLRNEGVGFSNCFWTLTQNRVKLTTNAMTVPTVAKCI